MRSFYVLGLDPRREDLQSVVDADLDDFDTKLLNQGVRIEQLPPNMRLYLSKGGRAGLLGNAFGWKILSDEAIECLRELVSDQDYQLFPLTLIDFESRSPVGGYRLVNNLLSLPALAFNPGNRLVYAHQVVIRESSVPEDVQLFRCTEVAHHWILSEQLWKKLAIFDGFDATAVRTVA
jgi:hypothetical protein